MAAILTGTPVVVTWASGTDPAGQSITIPSDATAVYAFWAFFHATAGHGLASATLNGSAPDQSYELPNGGTDLTGTGVTAWYNPATGSQTLDFAWDATPSEGPTCIVVFVKDGDTSAWRDADAAQASGGDASAVTLTTVAGDLVIALDQKFGSTAPTAIGGSWISAQTATNNSESCRLSYISATAASEVCTSQAVDYSTMMAISIPASAGGVAYTLTAANGSYSLTGQAAGLKAARILTAAQGSYTITGGTAYIDTSINAAQGSYTLTGQAATLIYSGGGNRTITADSGSYTLTGFASSIVSARRLQSDRGDYTLTGQNAILKAARTLALDSGSYALTGQAAAFGVARNMPAVVGTYTLNGQTVTLTYSGFTPPSFPKYIFKIGGFRSVKHNYT